MPLESVTGYIGLAANDIENLAGLPERYPSGKASVFHLAKLKSIVNGELSIKSGDGGGGSSLHPGWQNRRHVPKAGRRIRRGKMKGQQVGSGFGSEG